MKKNTIFLSLTGFALPSMALQAQDSRPNILWLMAEDMGQDLECYGMKAVKTPVLNQLAKEGAFYTNAYCTNPISSPSRSAMMTGMHQTAISVHNHRSNRDRPLPDPVKPITYYLRNAGYTCILGNHQVMGKGRKTDCNFKHQPIGEYDGVTSFGLFDKFDEFTKEDQPFFAQIQLAVTHRGDWWKSVSSESARQVDPNKVALPPYLPDHPKVRAQWASYLDQVEYMDTEVGMILNELKEKGLLDNTVIFFISDNGRCEIRGKGYLYQPGIKIPMIAWGKGIKPQVLNEIVSTLDISATILDMAGVELPEHIMGKPLFSGEKRDYFYSARDTWDEVIDCMRAISTQRYHYIRNYKPERPWDQHQVYLDFHRPAIHVMRAWMAEGKLDRNALLFMADHKPKEELYDIQEDPHELINLAENPDYAPVLQDMRTKMEAWQKQYGDTGLDDLPARKTRQPKDNIRAYVQEKYPDEWKKLTEGDIGDKFGQWNSEYNATAEAKKRE